jgi:methionine-gamma-lyase
LLYGSPVYGGTAHFIAEYLPGIGIECIRFNAHHSMEEVIHMLIDSGKSSRLGCIFLETPANPTNDLFDIAMCREIADHFSTPERQVPVVVDNTFMGPVWSHPVKHGADLVVYSATKYIGGHSDLIAGAVLGNHELIGRIRGLRTFFGSMPDPHTCWLLTRSLETLKVRMEAQMENARLIAGYLAAHPLADTVHYLGLIPEGTKEYALFRKQYTSPGAMIAFDIRGGEEEAFRFMNELKLFKLAVSLGSTESLVQHPATMTHAGIPAEERAEMGITEKMVRLSIGLEDADDLIRDIEQALDKVAVSSYAGMEGPGADMHFPGS